MFSLRQYPLIENVISGFLYINCVRYSENRFRVRYSEVRYIETTDDFSQTITHDIARVITNPRYYGSYSILILERNERFKRPIGKRELCTVMYQTVLCTFGSRDVVSKMSIRFIKK